jgi:hypothetical protein
MGQANAYNEMLFLKKALLSQSTTNAPWKMTKKSFLCQNTLNKLVVPLELLGEHTALQKNVSAVFVEI